MEKKFDLEERLIEFAAQLIHFTESMVSSKSGNHLANQLLRSVTSTALNYGDAQSGESRKDFIHKFKIAAKEIEETKYWLILCNRSELYPTNETLFKELQEIGLIVFKIISSSKK